MNQENPLQVKQLFRDLGIRYLSRSLFLDGKEPELLLKESSYYKENLVEFISLTELYGSQLESSSGTASSIRWISQDIGYGLFSLNLMMEGDLLGEYAGIIQPVDAGAGKRANGAGWNSDYSWDFPEEPLSGGELEISALTVGNELRFVNHSAQPNLLVDHTIVNGRWIIFFKALRNIRAGEQFFVDYGEEYWSGGYREIKGLV